MQLQLIVNAQDQKSIQAAIEVLNKLSTTGEEVETDGPPVEAPRGRGRPPKVAAPEEVEELDLGDGGGGGAEEEVAPTLEQVIEAGKRHAQKHGREKTAKALTAKFGHQSLPKLKPEQYAAALKALGA